MKERMRLLIRRLVKWALKEELQAILEQSIATEAKFLLANNRLVTQQERIEFLYSFVQVGADISVHSRDKSWVVVCFKGEKQEYVQFLNLGDSDIREISRFLSKFKADNVTIDAPMFAERQIREDIRRGNYHW